MSAAPETKEPVQAARWETFVWPRWLPVRARMPLIAQITGAVALTALIVGPWWAAVPDAVPPPRPEVIQQAQTASQAPAIQAAPAAPRQPAAAPVRPAHLNLNVRHNFGNLDLTVSIDGKPALETRLAGSGKRFGVFGKRQERSFTKTLDLVPGVRVVRVRVRSLDDKFDQTRVERFELGSASVAALRVAADKSGLTLAAERPPVPPLPPVTAAVPAPVSAPSAAAPPPPVQAPAPVAASAAAPQSPQAAGAIVEMLQSLRSMLIGIAGFVASTATAFVVQEWLRSRRSMLFADNGQKRGPRRRRRRIQGAIDTR